MIAAAAATTASRSKSAAPTATEAPHPSAPAAAKAAATAADTAVRLFEAGYGDLISVLPPSATLSPKSKIPAISRGKAPGRKAFDGYWTGFGGWQKYETTLNDVHRWVADGANIGLRANNFPGLDIDSLEERIAKQVEEIALSV